MNDIIYICNYYILEYEVNAWSVSLLPVGISVYHSNIDELYRPWDMWRSLLHRFLTVFRII
jgi:hypothetical protein